MATQTKLVLFQGTQNADGTFAGATANGNGTSHNADDFVGAQIIEIRETAGGTATITLQGSFDGTQWYSVGYYQTDANASLTRTVTGISVTANAKHVYQVLDPYPQVRAVLSAVAGGAAVIVRGYLVGA